MNQGSFKCMHLKQIKKLFNGHLENFQKYHIMASDIVSKIAATYIITRSVSDRRGRGEKTSSVYGK